MSGQIRRLGSGTKIASGATASPFTLVPQPNVAFSFLPFDIYDGGENGFMPDPTWDISDQVPQTGTHYYVSKTGNDSTGDGLSWATSFLTVQKAYDTVGATPNCVIHVGGGKYGLYESANLQKSISLIGKRNEVVIFDNFINYGSWSLTAGRTYTWELTGVVVATSISFVLDYRFLDENADPTPLTLRTSIDEVEANENSYYVDKTNKILYVHTSGNLEPDADIRLNWSGGAGVVFTANDINIYIENIRMYSKRMILTSGGAGNTGKLYLNKCRIMFGVKVISYGYPIYAKDCQFANQFESNEDLIDIEGDPNGNLANCVFIDCEGWIAGIVGNQAANVITNHSTSAIVDLNGNYRNTYGPPIGLIFNGYFWGLGTYCHHNLATAGTNPYSFQFTLAGIWMDKCISSDSTKDVASTETTVFTHECIFPATSDATFEEYTY